MLLLFGFVFGGFCGWCVGFVSLMWVVGYFGLDGCWFCLFVGGLLIRSGLVWVGLVDYWYYLVLAVVLAVVFALLFWFWWCFVWCCGVLGCVVVLVCLLLLWWGVVGLDLGCGCGWFIGFVLFCFLWLFIWWFGGLVVVDDWVC